MGSTSPDTADPVAAEVLRHGLGAIADEMAITHVRASYSSVVRDMYDFSTAVCDGRGRVVAQGLTLALQLGAVPRFMRFVVGQVDPKPGDVYLLNDPWQGGVHLPDYFFAKPVFFPGETVPAAWTVMVSHMVDVGGRFPGGVSVTAGSVWEEGLLVPLVPLVREGVLNDPVLALITANSREPEKVAGDIRACLAALETGATQIREFGGHFGRAALGDAMDMLLQQTERAVRAAIAAVPDGVGEAVDHLDDDGLGGEPVRFACRVTKAGDRLAFDFTGTAPQVGTGINCTVADVMSVVAFVAAAALGEGLSVNDGFTRAIDFTVPEGSVANAVRPAAVGARAASIYRLTDVAMAAMSAIVPERLPANDGGPAVLFFSGARGDGRAWIFLDYVQAGWGATATSDGVPGVSHPISNAANIPIEVIEQEFPLRVLRYGLVAGTGGAGTFTGAPAVVREYEILEDDTTVNIRLQRALFPPKGLRGGGDGSPCACAIRRADADWEPVSTGTVVLARGDRVRVQLAAGGGSGPPEGRSAEALERDVRDGLEVTAHVADRR
jgi:N-methylhydantoinase B